MTDWLETLVVQDRQVVARDIPLLIATNDDAPERRALGETLEAWARRHPTQQDESQLSVLRDQEGPTRGFDPAGIVAGTADLADGAIDWLRHRARYAGAHLGWEDLLWVLRARDLDGPVGPRDRWRRLADGIGALGFARDLERLRVDPPHDSASPFAAVVANDAPRDVRIAPCGQEWGWLSEMAGLHALGRGLSLVLVAPALPEQGRREGSVSYGIGALLAQLLGDRVFLGRVRGLDRRSVDVVRRQTAATWILLLRAQSVHAAAVRSLEEGAQALALALRLEEDAVPSSLCALCRPPRQDALEWLEGTVAGLAVATAFRERYDEDWFRNPRAAEPIRAACQRGATLDAKPWCAELGVDGDTALSAFSRLAEWMG